MERWLGENLATAFFASLEHQDALLTTQHANLFSLFSFHPTYTLQIPITISNYNIIWLYVPLVWMGIWHWCKIQKIHDNFHSWIHKYYLVEVILIYKILWEEYLYYKLGPIVSQVDPCLTILYGRITNQSWRLYEPSFHHSCGLIFIRLQCKFTLAYFKIYLFITFFLCKSKLWFIGI